MEIVVEKKKNKREFNARAKELAERGGVRLGEFKNECRFGVHERGNPGKIVVLVRGWKKERQKWN